MEKNKRRSEQMGKMKKGDGKEINNKKKKTRKKEERKRRREEDEKRRREEEKKRRREEEKEEQSTLSRSQLYINTPDHPRLSRPLC